MQHRPVTTISWEQRQLLVQPFLFIPMTPRQQIDSPARASSEQDSSFRKSNKIQTLKMHWPVAVSSKVPRFEKAARRCSCTGRMAGSVCCLRRYLTSHTTVIRHSFVVFIRSSLIDFDFSSWISFCEAPTVHKNPHSGTQCPSVLFLQRLIANATA